MQEFVFKTDRLAVRARRSRGAGPCVVTFDSYTDQRTLDRPGFGERFFSELDIDAIHVISRQNDWYQYPELRDAGAEVRAALSGCDRVLAYGSSMGGYAAIRFGALFGAQDAAAFSPQFSIDASVVPFDRRWSEDAARIDFLMERDAPAFTPKSFIFYDPRDIDGRHVPLFRPHTTVVDIPVPVSGHPCITILSETGVLRPVLLRILERGEVDDFHERYRAARRASPQFFFNLSMMASRPRARSRLAEKGYALRGDAMYASHYGQMLAGEGRFAEALDLLHASRRDEPDNPVILYRHSEVQEMSGDVVGALETMDRVFAKMRDVRAFMPRRDHLSKRLSEDWRARFADVFGRPRVEAAAPEPEREPARLGLRERMRVRLGRMLGSFDHARSVERKDATVARPIVALEQEPDILLTTAPAPPQFVSAWKRHIELCKRAPHESLDLLLVGDSLAEWWPDHFFEGLSVFNFGMAGDRTQHLLWRLSQLPDRSLRAKCALIVIGTNNLGCGDGGPAIVAGVDRVREMAQRKAQIERLVILEIPAMGPDFAWRGEERRNANEGLRALGVETLNLDDELTGGGRGASNYMPDCIHFSEAGYGVLTRRIRQMSGGLDAAAAASP